MRRQASTLAATTVLALLAGCGDSDSAATTGGTGTTAGQSGTWESVDWDAVQPADAADVASVFSQLARYVDAWHEGEREQVTLFCDKDGRIADRFGNSGEITLGEWKLYLENIRTTPNGRTAARAMLAVGFDHDDGLGKVPRFAYFVEEGELEGSLLFTLVEAKEGVSGG